MTDVETVLAILQAACETDSPAALMTSTMAMSSPGRLVRASHEGITLRFPRALPHGVSPGLPCAVTFPNAGRTMGFLAPALRCEAGADGRMEVVVAVPERIQRTEKRLAVRVPVPDDTLRTRVVAGDHGFDVRPLDISLHGLLVEVADTPQTALEVGHRRMVELSLGRHHAVLEAEVRRRDGPRFGLLFVQRDVRPKALARIVSEIGRLWADD